MIMIGMHEFVCISCEIIPTCPPHSPLSVSHKAEIRMAVILFILKNKEAEAQRGLKDLLTSHRKVVAELILESTCPECHLKFSHLYLVPCAYHLCLYEGRSKDLGAWWGPFFWPSEYRGL